MDQKELLQEELQLFFEMPNTIPPTTCATGIRKKISNSRKNSFCNYSFFVGASKENIR